MTQHRLSSTSTVTLVAAWVALAGNAALWQKLGAMGLLNAPLAVVLFVMLWGGVATLLSLFAWRWTLKPAALLLMGLSAFAAHFMLTYGVVIDPGMITNALQTDVHEAKALFNVRLVVTVGLIALVPGMLLLRQQVDHAPPWRQLFRNALLLISALGLAIGATLAGYQPLASLMRNHHEMRYILNPLASFYSLGRVAAKPFERDNSTLTSLGSDAHLAQSSRPVVMLLVLGETARSDNFGLNGYGRDTTPELAKQGVVSFHNAWSCGTSTAASVPCMFSNLGREAYAHQKMRSENLLDVLQHAGLGVLWIDNQSGCKGVCDRVPNVPTGCAEIDCLDEAMFKDLEQRIATLDPKRVAAGLVVVMHQIGSHGPAYYLRSPATNKPFKPECTTSSLNDCPRELVLNAYDNSIHYTDHFLSQAISWLKTQTLAADTLMLYVSDHGESLGEGNLYLHGLPYAIAPDQQKHVPWIMWASEGFQRNRLLSMDCLRMQQDRRVSHDSYFHSVLGLMGVQTSTYNLDLDAYAPCRGT